MVTRRFRWVIVAVVAVILGGVAAVILMVPAVESPYRLPWASGVAHSVLQGNFRSEEMGGCVSGCGTHHDDAMRYAWDFDLPEGTEVLAARGGTVALLNGSWPSDHCGGIEASGSAQISSPRIGNEANFVEIAHGDGTSALYLHLSEVDPAIERKAKSGEPVVQGELLGLSGKTGYTQCSPHLHFQVENSVKADWFTTSQPIAFADHDVVSRTPLGVPVEGQTYVSGNIAVRHTP